MTLLWLPGHPLMDSTEAGALDDLDPPPPPPRDPWKEPAMTTTRRGCVDLDEVVHLLRYGDTIETVARTLGVREDSIVKAATQRGTPDQRARIARAAEDMKDRRLGMAS